MFEVFGWVVRTSGVLQGLESLKVKGVSDFEGYGRQSVALILCLRSLQRPRLPEELLGRIRNSSWRPDKPACPATGVRSTSRPLSCSPRPGGVDPPGASFCFKKMSQKQRKRRGGDQAKMD